MISLRPAASDLLGFFPPPVNPRQFHPLQIPDRFPIRTETRHGLGPFLGNGKCVPDPPSPHARHALWTCTSRRPTAACHQNPARFDHQTRRDRVNNKQPESACRRLRHTHGPTHSGLNSPYHRCTENHCRSTIRIDAWAGGAFPAAYSRRPATERASQPEHYSPLPLARPFLSNNPNSAIPIAPTTIAESATLNAGQ